MTLVERKTRIFLESGDPADTRRAIEQLGFLHGQLTNPLLIAPKERYRSILPPQFDERELVAFYRRSIEGIAELIGREGVVGWDVYADAGTSAEEMLRQARTMTNWAPAGVIKFPASAPGLEAAEQATREEIPSCVSLCFSQEQAAAAYVATQGIYSRERLSGGKAGVTTAADPTERGAFRGAAYLALSTGPLNDQGQKGMELVENVLRMFHEGDAHVQVVVAGIRTIEEWLYALKLEPAAVAAPLEVLVEWSNRGMPQPDPDYRYERPDLQPIPYQEIHFTRPWHEFHTEHAMTRQALEAYSRQWRAS